MLWYRFSFLSQVGVYLEKALRDKDTPLENMPKVNSSSMDMEKDLEASWEESTISWKSESHKSRIQYTSGGRLCEIPVPTTRGRR